MEFKLTHSQREMGTKIQANMAQSITVRVWRDNIRYICKTTGLIRVLQLCGYILLV